MVLRWITTLLSSMQWWTSYVYVLSFLSNSAERFLELLIHSLNLQAHFQKHKLLHDLWPYIAISLQID